MNSGVKKLKLKLKRADTNRRDNARAKSILTGMPGTLSAAYRKLCDDYARDVLGSRAYAPWLYVYSHTAGEFREGWIPNNYYSNYVVNASPYSFMSRRRFMGPKLFGPEHFPDFAYLNDGRGYTQTAEILDPSSLAQILLAHSDRIIFKSDGSSQGSGIQFLTQATFEPDQIGTLGNGVFQHVITQHPDFDPISQGSLATIRITTAVNNEGIPTIRGTYLRVARAKETHVKSQSALRVAFDIDTGRLSDVGYLTDWDTIACHPDTGAPFGNIEIPNIQACAALVLKLHSRFPFAECLGWDLAVDEKGVPHVLEWNDGHNDIKFSEATQGPFFQDLDWADRWRHM